METKKQSISFGLENVLKNIHEVKALRSRIFFPKNDVLEPSRGLRKFFKIFWDVPMLQKLSTISEWHGKMSKIFIFKQSWKGFVQMVKFLENLRLQTTWEVWKLMLKIHDWKINYSTKVLEINDSKVLEMLRIVFTSTTSKIWKSLQYHLKTPGFRNPV